MIPLTLPTRPDRPLLTSFWLALCTFTLAALVLVVLLTGQTVLGILGGSVLLVAAVAGFLRGDVVAKIYVLWNRAARKVGRFAEAATLRVCYQMVLAPVGRVAGSRMPLRAPTQTASGWVAHGTDGRPSDGQGVGGTAAASSLASSRGGWVSQLAGRAVGSGRPWMLVLIPYVALLRSYAPSKTDGSVLGHNYTLY